MTDIKEYEKHADLLKAMAHPHRLCIVKGLLEQSCNVTKIGDCLSLPQSTVSQHLSRLKSAGILEGKRDGNEICYTLVNDDAIRIVKMLFGI